MTDLLPPNATALERAFDQAAGARVASVDFGPLRTLKDPATCPAHLLPWLAWERSVDTWTASLTEAQRRAVIAAAPTIHRIKGTPAAVRLALQALGLADVEIQDGLPALAHDGEAIRAAGHTYAGTRRWALFRVIADVGDDVGIDPATTAQIIRAIERAKNVRSHLYALTWRANVRIVGGPATLSADLHAHLMLAARQGVRDGRYSRVPVPAPLDRRGDILADGTRTRADRHPADTLPYALGHLRRTMPVSADMALTATRPTLLPRDGRIPLDATVRRGRPHITIAPAPLVTRRRPPRTGAFDRRGYGPARAGTLTYATGQPRGGLHIHSTITHTLPEAA